MTEAVLQLLSAQAGISPFEVNAGDILDFQTQDLMVGDIVQSKEQHWLKTGQRLSGAILRLEKVPESQIQAAGCSYWAYLNSGEGPVSTELLEKVPSVHSQLASLHAALENFREEFEPEGLVIESPQGAAHQ